MTFATYGPDARNTILCLASFLVHGEPQASDALRQHIERALHWDVTMPEYRQSYHLG